MCDEHKGENVCDIKIKEEPIFEDGYNHLTNREQHNEQNKRSVYYCDLKTEVENVIKHDTEHEPVLGSSDDKNLILLAGSTKAVHQGTHIGAKKSKPSQKSNIVDNDEEEQSQKSRSASDTKEKKQTKCDICKKTFHKKSYLTKHLWIHTGQLPFKCEFCDKAFNIRGNLAVHMRIHTGQKPHDCGLCEKSFRQRGQLEYHMRTHTGEKPYTCEVCSHTFRNSSGLITHQRTHTGERPFKCELCSRSFSTSTSLKTHRVTHSGTMLYDCPVCGRQFNRRNNLNVHIKRHDKNRKFSCPLCSNGFVMRAHVLNHLKRSHNVDINAVNFKYKELLDQCHVEPTEVSPTVACLDGTDKINMDMDCDKSSVITMTLVDDTGTGNHVSGAGTHQLEQKVKLEEEYKIEIVTDSGK